MFYDVARVRLLVHIYQRHQQHSEPENQSPDDSDMRPTYVPPVWI